MCIYETVICTECKTWQQVCQPCHIPFASHPSNMESHAIEVREAPIEGLCNACTDPRSALCEFILGNTEQLEPPESPIEQLFDQMTMSENTASEMDEASNEELSELAGLSLGPSDEEKSEEEVDTSASLSDGLVALALIPGK